MRINLKLLNRRNPDPDDPDNFMSRDGKVGGSSVIPWMFGGMFIVATLFGLFFASGSPLSYRPAAHVTQAPNLPVLPNTHPN